MKNKRKNKISKKTGNEILAAVDDHSVEQIRTSVSWDHHGWDILIGKLDAELYRFINL